MGHDDYSYIWVWKASLPERKGQRCRKVQVNRGAGHVLVQFQSDGAMQWVNCLGVRRVGCP